MFIPEKKNIGCRVTRFSKYYEIPCGMANDVCSNDYLRNPSVGYFYHIPKDQLNGNTVAGGLRR